MKSMYFQLNIWLVMNINISTTEEIKYLDALLQRSFEEHQQ